MKKATLKPGKEVSILRKHPWVFSGAIKEMADTTVGDWVKVYDSQKKLLGVGHVGDGSIAIRMLAFEAIVPSIQFWKMRLENCLKVRELLGYLQGKDNNAFRLVHGEGDGLPGLIIDIYNDCAVLQAHSHGMLNCLDEIAQAIQLIETLRLSTIYNKSAAAMHGQSTQDGFLLGNSPETIALENGLQFKVNWITGQKTGFFLDQRDNRNLLRQFAKGRSVLNTFCYTGGFSVAALKGGASEVFSVDISGIAVAMANENVGLLKLNANQKHTSRVADVIQYLREEEKQFDIVVIDPPAFAKSLAKKHNAVMGYKRLNTLGILRVQSGGLLFTFSCSQVINDSLFANTITAAGIAAGRNCRILYRLGQGADHPVNLYHPEGHYLKGLVLLVD